MERRYRLKESDSPQSLAVLGKGHASDLRDANKTWLSSDFTPWNQGQQMTTPSAWAPIIGEFPA